MSSELEIPTAVKQVTITKRRSFHDNTAITLNTPTVAEIVTNLKELATLTPWEIDISYGIGGDPADGSNFEWFLAVVDLDDLPGVASLRRNSIWNAAQHWRKEGTPAEFFQTLSRESADFFVPVAYKNFEPAERRQNRALAIVVHTSATLAMISQGTVGFQQDIIQRTWRGDDSWKDVTGKMGSFGKPSNSEGKLLLHEYLIPLWQ